MARKKKLNRAPKKEESKNLQKIESKKENSLEDTAEIDVLVVEGSKDLENTLEIEENPVVEPKEDIEETPAADSEKEVVDVTAEIPFLEETAEISPEELQPKKERPIEKEEKNHKISSVPPIDQLLAHTTEMDAISSKERFPKQPDSSDESGKIEKFHLPLFFWVITFIFMGVFLFAFIQFSNNKEGNSLSTYQHIPLAQGMAQGEVNAGGSAFNTNMPALMTELNSFYEKTGVIPILVEFYVMPGFSEDPNFNENWQLVGDGSEKLYYNSLIQTYAYDGEFSAIYEEAPEWFYRLLSPDESHLVLIYATDYGSSTGASYYWYYAGTSASTVFDAEAAKIFDEEIQKAWETQGEDVAMAMGTALVGTADQIMAVPEQADDSWVWLVGLGLVEIIILVGIGVFLWQRSKTKTGNKKE